jgi:hypothetical protein
LNRNSKDFANPDIYDELATFDCKIVPSFKDGVALIASLQSTPPEGDANPEGQVG